MKRMSVLKVGVLLAAACVLPAGLVEAVNVGVSINAPAIVYPSSAPPVPLVETPPPSPGSDYVWINGSWTWGDNHRWTWDKGRWDRPPHEGMHYVPNHYADRGHNRHVLQRGGWR